MKDKNKDAIIISFEFNKNIDLKILKEKLREKGIETKLIINEKNDQNILVKLFFDKLTKEQELQIEQIILI